MSVAAEEEAIEGPAAMAEKRRSLVPLSSGKYARG